MLALQVQETTGPTVAPNLYLASPPQVRFHSSTHKRRLLRSGNQLGKTEAGVQESKFHIVGMSPFRPIEVRRPFLGLIVVSDWTSGRQVIGRRLWEVLPRHLLAPGSDWNPDRGWKHSQITLRDGSMVFFRSSEQDEIAVSAMTLDWAWIDEPPKQGIFSEVQSRLMVTGGPLWMTLTPVGRPVDWLREHIEGDTEKGTLPTEEWEQHRIRLTTYDCPHRSPESIVAQRSVYLASERAQRADGEWEGVATGRIFQGFNESLVTTDIPARLWRLGLGLDHGELVGHEVGLFICWDETEVCVLDEWGNEQTASAEDDAEEIRALLGGHGVIPAELDSAIGDINSAGKQGAGAKVNDLMGRALGISIRPAKKGPGSENYGLRLLAAAMRHGRFRVHPRCRRLIKALRYWEGKDDDLKHWIDALRYITREPLERILKKTPEAGYLRVV